MTNQQTKRKNRGMSVIVGILIALFILLFIFGKKNENQSTEKEISIIPKNCTVWFDGCNNCQVSTDPKIPMACTRMFCDEENMREPKCIEFK